MESGSEDEDHIVDVTEDLPQISNVDDEDLDDDHIVDVTYEPRGQQPAGVAELGPTSPRPGVRTEVPGEGTQESVNTNIPENSQGGIVLPVGIAHPYTRMVRMLQGLLWMRIGAKSTHSVPHSGQYS